MNEIHGKSILVRVSARFELARVRVIGSRLYLQFHLCYTPVTLWQQLIVRKPGRHNKDLAQEKGAPVMRNTAKSIRVSTSARVFSPTREHGVSISRARLAANH